jgi:hypothetical protein
MLAVFWPHQSRPICGDFSGINNPQTYLEEYFLPLLDGLCVLSRKVLSVLDKTQTYQYLKSGKESQKFPTLATQEGCYGCLQFHMESHQDKIMQILFEA